MLTGNDDQENGATATADIIAVSAENCGVEIAQVLIEQGLLTSEQLRHGQRVLAKLEAGRPLLSVLTALHYVDEEQVRTVLRARRLRLPLGCSSLAI